MCMNEVSPLSLVSTSDRTKIQMSFGSPLPNSFGSILRIRMPSPQHQRDCLLGHRFNQAQLTAMGLLDGTAEPEKLIETCKELALREGPRVGWGVWGIIKVRLRNTSSHHDRGRETKEKGRSLYHHSHLIANRRRPTLRVSSRPRPRFPKAAQDQTSRGSTKRS
jgi:enoyl-CoA hydratase/carnithine racemase